MLSEAGLPGALPASARASTRTFSHAFTRRLWLNEKGGHLEVFPDGRLGIVPL